MQYPNQALYAAQVRASVAFNFNLTTVCPRGYIYDKEPAA